MSSVTGGPGNKQGGEEEKGRQYGWNLDRKGTKKKKTRRSKRKKTYPPLELLKRVQALVILVLVPSHPVFPSPAPQTHTRQSTTTTSSSLGVARRPSSGIGRGRVVGADVADFLIKLEVVGLEGLDLGSEVGEGLELFAELLRGCKRTMRRGQPRLDDGRTRKKKEKRERGKGEGGGGRTSSSSAFRARNRSRCDVTMGRMELSGWGEENGMGEERPLVCHSHLRRHRRRRS
jgi:hypothetical protein